MPEALGIKRAAFRAEQNGEFAAIQPRHGIPGLSQRTQAGGYRHGHRVACAVAHGLRELVHLIYLDGQQQEGLWIPLGAVHGGIDTVQQLGAVGQPRQDLARAKFSQMGNPARSGEPGDALGPADDTGHLLDEALADFPNATAETGDGYDALIPAMRGAPHPLILIDPPYEAQEQEYGLILQALNDALTRWPTGIFAVWYPIKQRPSLHPFFRKVATLPVKSALAIELLVRPDDSPLRMNGSGMLLLNPPWQIEKDIEPALKPLAQAMGEPGASWRLTWLKQDKA
mgnify:CR=1 FL=1